MIPHSPALSPVQRSPLSASHLADASASVLSFAEHKPPTCPHCGSLLSAVTWTCVRGSYCPGNKSRRSSRYATTFRAEAARVIHVVSVSVCVALCGGVFSMSSLSASPRPAATESVRQDWRETDTSAGDVLSDIAKRTLWPGNTAPNLAAACGCSVRMAERYLGGQCDWSGDAIAAVVTEILKRHSMRNVKIIKRE